MTQDSKEHAPQPAREIRFEVDVFYYARRNETLKDGLPAHEPYDTSAELSKRHFVKCFPGVKDPYPALAEFCMRQTARRDILVTRFTVQERVKREITVKTGADSRGGIIIRGKRYFGLGSVEAVEYDDENRMDETDTPPAVAETAPPVAPTPTPSVPVDTPPPAATPAQPVEFDLESLRSMVAPFNSEIPHPLLRGYVTCDSTLNSRAVYFTPAYSALESKYNLNQGQLYPVYTRVIKKDEPGALPFTLLRNSVGEYVLVEETHLTEQPDPSIAADYTPPNAPVRIHRGGSEINSAPVLRGAAAASSAPQQLYEVPDLRAGRLQG